jgi:caffeoyl-CoA O-methyltransferase
MHVPAIAALFHEIPESILKRMGHLEKIDAADRSDGTPRSGRLRQIPPETGKFIALLAAGAPSGRLVEIGTSAGDSTLWLSLACRLNGTKITTLENSPAKIALAEETFIAAEVNDLVELIYADAVAHLPGFDKIAFCFLDAEKEIYSDCYELLVPRLTPGGLIVADNAIDHERTLRPMLDRALSDERVDAMIVPVGKGVVLCRKR